MACVGLWVLCHLGLGSGQAKGVGSIRICRTGSTDLLEGGGEAGGPSRSWSDVQHGGTTSSHIHGVLGGHKALSALLGVTSASCHPEVQEVTCCPGTVIPNWESTPLCPQRGVFLPVSHLGVSSLPVSQLLRVGPLSGGGLGPPSLALGIWLLIELSLHSFLGSVIN